MSRFLQSSTNVSNFHSSFSIARKNYITSLKSDSFFLTSILTGSFINFFVNSMISGGKVVENNPTYKSGGNNLNISSVYSQSPLPSISSASSSRNNLMKSIISNYFLSISSTLPGVPTTTCTPSLRILLSSIILVPPVHRCTETLSYSPIESIIL